MSRLLGKVALITGGTSGIGEATARLFAAEGAQVAFTGRRRERGEAIAAEINGSGGHALYIEADMTRLDDCRRSVEATLARYGQIDVLFNNAGIALRGRIEDIDEAGWDRAFDINVKSVYRMTRLVIPVLRRQGGGVIVNNASDWGVVGGPLAAGYCATKGAVVLLTKAVALDHARENIRVNAVCPGDTIVERWRADPHRNPTGDFEQALKEMGEDLPIGRLGTVEEIARVVLFLASDDSSFMTGAALLVDGGNTAG
jgi:NAD(P)-dependent dehydrogenase (short-subunit alcohol dehydrogenase family)